MARSCSYPTQYRCGSFSGKDVYWSPSQGWAIEDDHWHLVQHALDPGVRFFHDAEDFGAMEDDVEENDGLFDAMPCDLREAFIAEKEKRARWAEEDAIEYMHHIDGDLRNNQLGNLRLCALSQHTTSHPKE